MPPYQYWQDQYQDQYQNQYDFPEQYQPPNPSSHPQQGLPHHQGPPSSPHGQSQSHPQQYSNFQQGQYIYDQQPRQFYGTPQYGAQIPQYNQFNYQANQYQFHSQPLPPPPQVVIPPRSSLPHPQPPYRQPQTQVPQPMQRQPTISLVNTEVLYNAKPSPMPSSIPTTITPPNIAQPQVLQNVHINVPPMQSQPPKTSIAPIVETPRLSTRSASPTPVLEGDQDYPVLLLTLADDYLDSARRLSQRSKDYYTLVATALGCLEAALKNFQFAPLREAQISLRYAQLLYDETENLDDAAAVLARTIDLCERMKFLDLKYAGQMLRAKILYRSSPKAAMKDLASTIADIETYKHTAWQYAFRFQYVFLLRSSTSTSNLNEAISQLEKIQESAKRHRDYVVGTFAAILEAMLHLQTSNSESLQHSERALTNARTNQFNPEVEKHPQINVLMYFIDLCHATRGVNDQLLIQKANNTKEVLHKAIDELNWAKDGTIYLPLHWQSLKGIEPQDGGLITTIKDRRYLTLSWMGSKEIETLGLLFCASSLTSHNQLTRGVPEKSIAESIKICEELLSEGVQLTIQDEETQQRRVTIQIHCLLELAFMRCARGQWTKAQESVLNAKNTINTLHSNSHTTMDLSTTLTYLEAAILQGTGQTNDALNLYLSPTLTLPSTQAHSTSSKPLAADSPTTKQIRLLSALCICLLTHSPTHPQHSLYHTTLHNINTFLPTLHPLPPYLTAAHALATSLHPATGILAAKKLIGTVLDAGKASLNSQMIGLALTLMQERFFRGGVQDSQATKCARAAAHQVKTRWGDPLWVSVASQLGMEGAEISGVQAEAERWRVDRDKERMGDPARVRDGLGLSERLDV